MLNTLVVVAIVVILIIIVFRHLGSFRENINVISYVYLMKICENKRYKECLDY